MSGCSTEKPTYHVVAKEGWLGDPTGPFMYQGKYHLFYQHLPNTCEWNFGVEWGHCVSTDLIHWQHLPHALVPTAGGLDADGCFAGCAAVDRDGTPILLYTGVRKRTNVDAHPQPPPDCDLHLPVIEAQLYAVASDPDDPLLIHWVKEPAPFIGLPPPNMNLTGWRSPFMVERPCETNDWEWIVLMGSGIKEVGGATIVYRTRNLREASSWRYDGLLCVGNGETGAVWERPILAELTPLPAGGVSLGSCAHDKASTCLPLPPTHDKASLMLDAATQSCFDDRYTHFFSISPDTCSNATVYWLGRYADGRFDLDNAKGPFRLDLGDVLYAPTVMREDQGRVVLWGWLQEKRTVVGTYDYAGCMTVPRLLHLDGDRLHQSPAPELLCLRQGESWHCQDVILEPKAALAVPPGVVGSNFVDIEVVFTQGSASTVGIMLHSLQQGGEGGAAVLFHWETSLLEVVFEAADPATNKFSITSHLARRIGGFIRHQPGTPLALRMLLDGSCLEIFTGSGEVLSTRIYRGVIARNNGDTGIKFFALDGKTTVKRVAAYDMASIWQQSVELDAAAQPIKQHDLDLVDRALAHARNASTLWSMLELLDPATLEVSDTPHCSLREELLSYADHAVDGGAKPAAAAAAAAGAATTTGAISQTTAHGDGSTPPVTAAIKLGDVVDPFGQDTATPSVPAAAQAGGVAAGDTEAAAAGVLQGAVGVVTESLAALARELADWLDGGARQVVFVSALWLLDLPPEQQEVVVATFSLLGYWQIAELKHGLLLASPQGLDSMQREIQAKELQLFGGPAWKVAATAPTASPPDCGGQSGHQAGGGQQGSQRDGSTSQQSSQQLQGQGQPHQQQRGSSGSEGPGGDDSSTGAATSSVPAGGDGCRYHKLTSHRWQDSEVLTKLSSSHWQPVTQPGPEESSTRQILELNLKSHWQGIGALELRMFLTACSKMDDQGLSTVNLQIERLQAEAQAFGAESQGVMRCVKFTMQPDQLTPGTEHRNRINLVGQLRQPDGRSMLSQASPGTGHFGSQPMYQYREVTRKASVDIAKSLKATLGIDVSEKQALFSVRDKELPLVVMDGAQRSVWAQYGDGATPCTVNVIRYPLNTICCGEDIDLGVINTNNNNLSKHAVSLLITPHTPLTAAELQVKFALGAMGLIIGDSTHAASQEQGFIVNGVEVVKEIAGKDVIYLVTAFKVSVSDLLRRSECNSRRDCPVHSSA